MAASHNYKLVPPPVVRCDVCWFITAIMQFGISTMFTQVKLELCEPQLVASKRTGAPPWNYVTMSLCSDSSMKSGIVETVETQDRFSSHPKG
jgi:hypothetical protein